VYIKYYIGSVSSELDVSRFTIGGASAVTGVTSSDILWVSSDMLSVAKIDQYKLI
jgi:hypothetical protein